jgi:DNA repair protein RecN (Recombination protein N)
MDLLLNQGSSSTAPTVLIHLSIRDFAIVDRLDLEFRTGFTALTGETGAGKSILIDALSMALGERAGSELVRTGADRADVAAEFVFDGDSDLAELLREQALEGDPNRLILRRVVDRNGRSRAFVNGLAATVNQLRGIGERLVDIHGQHAHQSLLKSEAQRQILDAHSGLVPLAREVGAAYRDWQRLSRARIDHETNASVRDAEREQLRWQVEELTRLQPAAGEWDSVQAEHGRLAHAASLIEGVRDAIDSLSESEGAALGALSATLSRLRPLTEYDAALRETIEMLESGEAQLRESAYALRHYSDRVELDPARLKEVEHRLDAIHSAARKFRCRPEVLPDLLSTLQGRLKDLEITQDLEALVREEQAARARYDGLAGRLSTDREKAAAKLGKEVNATMRDLAMVAGRFEVVMHPLGPEGSAGGNEQVEFLVTTNPGSEPRPLAKVASGGELSRISLAIQVITSRAAAVPTLIFDEVDAGIGGAVAEVVGTKLKLLGAERQVLCVTHLPQVAAQANEQWSVAKGAEGGSVRSRVAILNGSARIEEIARMLGGVAITATTRKHAAELLGLR